MSAIRTGPPVCRCSILRWRRSDCSTLLCSPYVHGCRPATAGSGRLGAGTALRPIRRRAGSLRRFAALDKRRGPFAPPFFDASRRETDARRPATLMRKDVSTPAVYARRLSDPVCPLAAKDLCARRAKFPEAAFSDRVRPSRFGRARRLGC